MLRFRRRRRGVLEDLHRGPGPGQGLADHDRAAAGPGAAVHPARRAELLRAGLRAVEPQADLGRLVPGRGEQHRVPVGAGDVPDLQAGRGDRAGGAGPVLVGGAQQQAARPLGVGRPDDLPVAGPGGHPGHDVQPLRVGVLADQRGLPGGRVSLAQLHPALVPALHHEQRVGRVPAHRGQVGELGPVPADLGLAAVQPGQQQRHVRVGGARGRVADVRRWPARVGRVGDVPALHRPLVHPGGQDGRAVRRPPVAAQPAHLLGRDELGQPERQARRAAGTGQYPVLAGPDVDNVQRAGAHVADVPAVRVWPGVVRRVLHGDLLRRASWAAQIGQLGQVDATAQGEHGHPQVAVGGVADDPAGLLAGPFPARLLRGGQVTLGRVQRGWVGHQFLLPGGHVQLPQAGQRVGTGLAAQEGHPAAVRRDAERAGYAQGEPPGPGLLPRETLGHAPILPVPAPG